MTLISKGGGSIVLTVAGSLTGTKFAVQSDGHGGSDIVLEKSAAPPPALAPFGQYVAAGFGPHGHAAEATITPTPSAAGYFDLAASHA